jgi:hypothetical protein
MRALSGLSNTTRERARDVTIRVTEDQNVDIRNGNHCLEQSIASMSRIQAPSSSTVGKPANFIFTPISKR